MEYNLSNRNNSYHKGIDWVTVLLYTLLVVFGWFNLYAANFNPETKVFFSIDAEYFKQLMWIGVTIILIGALMLVDSKIFVELASILYGVSLLLLLLTLVVGKEVNGAKAWLGFGPVQFQPVEMTKIATALLISRIISRYGFSFSFRNIMQMGLVLLVPIAFVLLQNDTGSALIFLIFLFPMFREGMSGHILTIGIVSIIAAIASLLKGSPLVMCVVLALFVIALTLYLSYIGHKRVAFISVITGVFAMLFMALYLHFFGDLIHWDWVVFACATVLTVYLLTVSVIKRIKRVSTFIMYLWIALLVSFVTGYAFNNILIEHQRTRINILFGIEEDPLGAGYNVNQSLIAIGSGGVTGKGFLEGTQTKLNFVPKQSTDFIFCTVGEEWGFLGCVALIALYFAFFMRLIQLAEKQHSVFSRVYGYSIVCIFFFHFAVNICMTIGLMPVIGIPLPFFSYGGSSFLGFSMMLFIFLKLDTDRNELIR
mgnify:CR=1 FL=1